MRVGREVKQRTVAVTALIIPAELCGLIACAIGIYFTLKARSWLSGDGRIVLCALFLTVGASHGLDLLEWNRHADADQSGDIIKVLIPAVWLFFLFVVRRDTLLSKMAHKDRQLDYFFESSPIAVAVLDNEQCYVACSSTWLTLHAFTPHQVAAGKQLSTSDHGQFGAYLRAVQECRLSGALVSGTVYDPTTLSKTFIEYKARPYRVGDHIAGCILTAEDISRRIQEELERENAQRKLLISQNLETLGEIAAGVAHDVNNLLQVIYAHAEALDEAPVSNEEDHQDSLRSIREAVDAASDMTRWLLAHGKRQLGSYAPVDLCELLNRLVLLLRHALPRHQFLKLTLPDSSVVLQGDRTLLEQLVINLVLNARDAMPDGGIVRVRLALSDDHPVLTVSDEGSGIAEDIRDRILEPFFTTKGERGTGMGLTVVRRAVGAHGASLGLQTEPGQGTCFTIRFPVPGTFDPSAESGNPLTLERIRLRGASLAPIAD